MQSSALSSAPEKLLSVEKSAPADLTFVRPSEQPQESVPQEQRDRRKERRRKAGGIYSYIFLFNYHKLYIQGSESGSV